MNYRGTIAYRQALGGMVDEGFCASLVAAWDFLGRSDAPGPFHFMRGLSCMLHDAANRIAEGFLGDWVIFLDTDHVFTSDALYELITTFENEKLDILVGFTQKRQPPYLPMISRTEFNPYESFVPVIPKGMERHRLLSIDSSGLGCLMIRRVVFDEIAHYGEKPFDMRRKFNSFDLKTGAELNILRSPLPPDRHSEEAFWEDVSFFWRAKMLGFKSFCAPWIKFHHIEKRLVDETLIQAPVSIDPRIPV